MAKIVDLLKNKSSTPFSFEILPPVKGDGIQKLFDSVEDLMEFKPSFIDVTYHREEYVYRSRGQGLLEKRTVRKRPGTVGICASLMNRFGVETVPHIICGGFSREETENALIDLNFLGINNVLLLRGDPIKSEGRFQVEPDGHGYASELLEQVVKMNKGEYLDEELVNPTPTDFCIGVAGYPEKHFEAPNMHQDLKYLKLKAEMGADYVVTQMFFDNRKYFEFVEHCQALGITIPIIPGLKPITTKRQLSILPSTFYIDFPPELVAEVEKCQNNEQVRRVGIEWCIAQSKELKQKGVPCLHYYSMGKSTAIREIAEALF